MSQENVEIVRRALDAYTRRDIETLRVIADPDVELDWSASRAWLAGIYRGLEETLRFYDGYFEAFKEIVIEPDDFIEAGESVVVPNIAHQIGRDGIQVSARSTLVFTLRSAKLIRICLYQETEQALKAVGLADRAMSSSNVELVQRGFEHYMATGEIPWDLFDEEIEIHDHDTPDQGAYRGHAGYGRWLDDWGAAWAEWSIEPEEYIDAGDSVVVFVRMRTKGRGSGVEVERQDALVYKVQNGRIVRGDYYNDRAEALHGVGLDK